MNENHYFAWPTGEQEAVRTRIAGHQALDQIVQGEGWVAETGAGCAIGCSLDSYDHDEYSRVLGVPTTVAYLIDAIHDNLASYESVAWPGRVAAALTPGAETTVVWERWAVWLLSDECPSDAGALVAGLYRRRIAGDEPSLASWELADAREWVNAPAAWALDVLWPSWSFSSLFPSVRNVVASALASASEAAWSAALWSHSLAARASCLRMGNALVEILESCEVTHG